MEDSPSVGLYDAVSYLNRSEWILFGLARDNGAGMATFIFADNAVENQNWYTTSLSFDYVPDLSNSCSTRAKT